MLDLSVLVGLAKDYRGVFEGSDAKTLVEFVNYVAHRQGVSDMISIEGLQREPDVAPAKTEVDEATPKAVEAIRSCVRRIAREEIIKYMNECLRA